MGNFYSIFKQFVVTNSKYGVIRPNSDQFKKKGNLQKDLPRKWRFCANSKYIICP